MSTSCLLFCPPTIKSSPILCTYYLHSYFTEQIGMVRILRLFYPLAINLSSLHVMPSDSSLSSKFYNDHLFCFFFLFVCATSNSVPSTKNNDGDIACCCLLAKSCPTLYNSWTIAHEASLSVGFPRQEYWNGLPFLSPRDLPDLGTEPTSPELAGEFFTSDPPG